MNFNSIPFIQVPKILIQDYTNYLDTAPATKIAFGGCPNRFSKVDWYAIRKNFKNQSQKTLICVTTLISRLIVNLLVSE